MPEPLSRSSSSENDIFSFPDTLIPERDNKQAGTTHLSFDGLFSPPLLLHEDLKGGCGGQLWPAGMALAKYLLHYHEDSLKSKHMIEIGAGGGLVGLAVARGCDLHTPILITDQEPMLALMEKNIQLNGLDARVHAQIYDWGVTVSPSFATSTGYPDIVLAADCVYFEPAFPLLLQTLSNLVGPQTVCYFCFKKRRKADMRFIRDLRKTFVVGEIDYPHREQNTRQGIYLHRVTIKTMT